MREVDHHRRRRLLAGLALLGAVLLASLVAGRPVLAGWLAAFIVFSALPLGALFLALLMRLISGRWRQALGASTTLFLALMPWALAAALPVVLGAFRLYPWAQGVEGAFKSIYLTPTFFALRSLLILALACLVALSLARRQARPVLVIAALILFPLLHGLLATDWLMSLDPAFASSGFGLYVLSLQVLISLCGLAIMSVAVLRVARETHAVMAALLLTAGLLWAYFGFMQYLVLWSGNLPPDAAWYNRRGAGFWHLSVTLLTIPQLLAIGLLLLPSARRSGRGIVASAVLFLMGKVVEVAWLVLPALDANQISAAASYLACLAGLGLVGSTGPFLLPGWPAPSPQQKEAPHG